MPELERKTLIPWSTRQLLAALVMLVAAFLSMRSAWFDWAELSWHDEEHSHVFLVIPFAAAIIYVNRKRFANLPSSPSWAGPLVVLAGAALSWEGFNHAHQSFWHVGAVLVAVGAGITVLGHQVILRFLPAFLLLGLMVPMPNTLRLQIAHPLQHYMAMTTEKILTTLGEPVGRRGNLLTINGQEVAIVEACNGLRMVFTLILVSYLFAFITPLKNWVRWTIVLLSPVTALICNVIRLIPTLLLYGHGSKVNADRFHDYGGWIMILFSFFMLMGVITLMEAFGIDVRHDDTDPETIAKNNRKSETLKPAVMS